MKKKSRIIFALLLGFLWSVSAGLIFLIANGLGIPNISAGILAPVILSVVIYFLSFMIWEKAE